jgi:hypothetical protein
LSDRELMEVCKILIRWSTPCQIMGVNRLRSALPTQDRIHVGLTTYDAKDPNTKFPPIRHLKSRS